MSAPRTYPWRFLQRSFVLVAVLGPPALFIWLFFAQRIPAEAVRESMDLAGTWKVLDGDLSDAALAAESDATAGSLKLPGGLSQQGITARRLWLRRHVELSPVLAEQPLFFLLGDTRMSVLRLYVNGHFLGETERAPRGAKTDFSGREGWDVPSYWLHPGDNVVALHLETFDAGQDGIHSAQLLLGPSRLLKQFYLDTAERRRVVQFGAAALTLFLAVLLGTLVVARPSAPNRTLYVWAILMLLAAWAYLNVSSGGYFRLRVDRPSSPWLVYLVILSLTFTQPEFLLGYFQVGGRVRWFHRIFCGSALTVLAIATLFQKPELAKGAFLLGGLYILLMSLFVLFLGVREVQRYRKALDITLTSAAACSFLTAVSDLLNDVGLVPSDRMYSMGIAASAIMAAIVLVADFIRIAFDNEELTASLQLTNAELADALVKAQEASRLKSEFVANVSHELRTPLNSVINIPEGLLDQFVSVSLAVCRSCGREFQLEGGDQIKSDTDCPACGSRGELDTRTEIQFGSDLGGLQRHLRQVHRAGTSLLRLIDDVLDFSRLESGRDTLHLAPTDIRGLLERVVETLKPLSEPRRIRVSLDAPHDASPLLCDAVKLTQVSINLVGNAIKFSAEGSDVWIKAQLAQTVCRIEVRDVGIGIAPEFHQAIFESFRQVDGSNTRRFGGTGLGLAISRRLVEAHGGRISLESALGKGSTFTVELPAEQGKEAVVPTQAEVLVPQLPLGAPTVLVLDDDPLAVENLKLALRPLRVRVVGINDPTELERTLVEADPDLLILDLLLPNIDGLEVLRALRQRGSTLPILVASAYPDKRELVEVLGASWLGKPWRSNALQQAVTQLLGRSERTERKSRAAAT